jgi:hypothetical protein
MNQKNPQVDNNPIIANSELKKTKKSPLITTKPKTPFAKLKARGSATKVVL